MTSLRDKAKYYAERIKQTLRASRRNTNRLRALYQQAQDKVLRLKDLKDQASPKLDSSR